jgi:hypothetical protein
MGSQNAHGCVQNAENVFSDEFLNHIMQVTDDETWASFMNAAAKEQSKQ